MKNWFFIEDAMSGPAGDVTLVGTPTTFAYGGSNTTSNSFSHNRIASTKGALVVAAMTRLPTNSVTFNGVGLTLIRSNGFVDAGCSYWIGDNTLATGSNTIVITHSGSQNACVVRCENLENVNQTTLTVDDDGNGAFLSSSSLSLTIAVGNLMMDTISKVGFDPIANGDGNQSVLLLSTSSNNIEGAVSYNTSQTAGSKTLAWTWSSTANTGHVAIEINNG